MFCPNCGNALSDGVRFCTRCGTALTASQPAIPEIRKKRKLPMILGLCAGLLLVIAIVVAVILLFPGKETVYLLTGQTTYSQGSPVSHIAFDYDPQGRLIDIQLQNAEGEVHRQFWMEYDEHGNRTLESSKRIMADPDNPFVQETFYDFSYDDKGRVETCEVSRGENSIENVYTFSYDDHGNLILVEWEVENPGFSSICAAWQYYEYDKAGNLTAEYFCSKYSMYGTPITSSQVLRNTYEYDSRGNLTEAKTASFIDDKDLDPDDLPDMEFETNAKSIWEFAYDRNGRLRSLNDEELEYDPDGNPDVEGFVFDAHGNLICEEQANGRRTEYTYKEVTLSRADAQLAQRQKTCLPTDLTKTTFIFSLDPALVHMYPIILKNNQFYSYMIPHPIW